MPHELLWTFLSWSLIFPATFLIGSCYGSLFRQKDLIMRGILYYALGLATLSYGVVLLSAFHLLTVQFIWGMLFFFFLIRINRLMLWVEWLKAVVKDLYFEASWTSRILFAIFAISFFCLLLGTLTPELGGDALCYQLNLPKVFLRAGSLAPDPLDYNSYFPLFMNNLFLVGLATGGVLAAKLFHFFCGGLLFLALKRCVQNETGNRSLAYFVALVVLTTPTIYNTLSTAYVDVALAFYVFLSVWAFILALESRSAREYFLSGLLAGCSITIKYLAFISILGLVALWFYRLIVDRKFRIHLTGSVWFLGGVAIAAGYWLVRNWVLVGNPLFPYFGSIFGGLVRPPTTGSMTIGFGRSWFCCLSVYFNMFISPRSFGSLTTWIGVFYFLMMPFIVMAAVFRPRYRLWMLFWLIFTVLAFYTAQVDRYFVPVMPIMALCAAVGVSSFFLRASPSVRSWIRSFGKGFAILILCAYVALGVFHYRHAYRLWIGGWSWDDYLVNFERTISVAKWINGTLPVDSKILALNEVRLFYFDRPIVRPVFFEWRLGRSLQENPDRFTAFLTENGLTHILTNSARPEDLLADSPAVVSLARTGRIGEVYSDFSRNVRDEKYFYRVFAVHKEGGPADQVV